MYITKEQLQAYIQEQLLIQGLDDAGENIADDALFLTIETAVESEVHSYLEGRYQVPFAVNVPNLVTHSCLVLAAEAIWLRRGSAGDSNPFTKAAEAARKRLDDVRLDKVALSMSQSPSQDAGVLVTEESLIAGSGRLTL